MSRRCRKAFCASIGRYLACLALARGVTAEGGLERVARRLRPVSGINWCMPTCYTEAGVESNLCGSTCRAPRSRMSLIRCKPCSRRRSLRIISRLARHAVVNPSLLVKSSPAHCEHARCQRRRLVPCLLPCGFLTRLDLVEQLRRAFLGAQLFFRR